MPAEKYSYAPTRGEFSGVRTFAQQLKHIAADNYLLGAGILGEKPPVEVGAGEDGANAVRSKPEIIGYVKASFAYMHRAAASIDDAKNRFRRRKSRLGRRTPPRGWASPSRIACTLGTTMDNWWNICG